MCFESPRLFLQKLRKFLISLVSVDSRKCQPPRVFYYIQTQRTRKDAQDGNLRSKQLILFLINRFKFCFCYVIRYYGVTGTKFVWIRTSLSLLLHNSRREIATFCKVCSQCFVSVYRKDRTQWWIKLCILLNTRMLTVGLQHTWHNFHVAIPLIQCRFQCNLCTFLGHKNRPATFPCGRSTDPSNIRALLQANFP